MQLLQFQPFDVGIKCDLRQLGVDESVAGKCQVVLVSDACFGLRSDLIEQDIEVGVRTQRAFLAVNFDLYVYVLVDVPFEVCKGSLNNDTTVSFDCSPCFHSLPSTCE